MEPWLFQLMPKIWVRKSMFLKGKQKVKKKHNFLGKLGVLECLKRKKIPFIGGTFVPNYLIGTTGPDVFAETKLKKPNIIFGILEFLLKI